jgi:PAS domain S-box-containing protein
MAERLYTSWCVELANSLASRSVTGLQRQKLIDAIPALIWCSAPDGAAEILNKAWLEFSGLSERVAIGNGWRQIIHPDDREHYADEWLQLERSRSAGGVQVRLRRSDGQYRWFWVEVAPGRDVQGQVVGWCATHIEIGENERPGPTDALLIEALIRLVGENETLREDIRDLFSALDALAVEPDPNQLVAHILSTIIEQFGAHSSSVWRCGEANELLAFEFAFEDGRIVKKTDARFAGMDLLLPMEGQLAVTRGFRTGEPCVIEDIRTVRPFALRDRLLPLGVISILLVPMAFAGRLEGAIGLRFKQRRTFRAEEVELAQALTNQAMLLMQLAEFSAQSREAAVIAERNRIARDIHDTLAQGFTGIVVQLEAAEDAQTRGLPDEASAHLVRARDLARDGLNEARHSVQALRPLALDKEEFSAALNTLFERMVEGTRVKSNFTVLGQPRALPPEWEENLFRIAQEIVTNALRHAHPSHFTAKIIFSEHEVRLDLRDDGCGFDLMAKSDGFGLLGIRERVEAMGGRLDIESSKGRGANVLISLPNATTSIAGMS